MRCLALILEDVQVRKWSIRWSLGTQPRCETAIAMAMRAMLGRACWNWNRWSVRDDGLEARLCEKEEGALANGRKKVLCSVVGSFSMKSDAMLSIASCFGFGLSIPTYHNTRSGIPEHETQDFIKATADDDEIEDYSNHGRRLTNEVDDYIDDLYNDDWVSSSALSAVADAVFRSLALEFKSLSSNFAKDSGDEITLNLKYKIGKGRKFDVKYLTADVENNQVIDVNFTAANSSTSLYSS